MEYWRLLFHKITIGDIKKFEETYKGSEEERDTVKTVYLEKEGDMEAIMEQVSRFIAEQCMKWGAIIGVTLPAEPHPFSPLTMSSCAMALKLGAQGSI